MRRWRTLCQLDSWLRTPMQVLSMAWLAIVIVQLTTNMSGLISTIGTAIYIVFILEFLLRFSLSPSKRVFLKHNWLMLVALAVPALRLYRPLAGLRALGGLRGVRLVQVVGTANRSMNTLKATLARRGFAYVGGATVLVIALGAAGMLYLEPASQEPGGFTSYGDALWWTFMLLTTIGSQYWPVTNEGRILAVVLSIYALGVFGYLTAVLASYFVGRDAQEPDAPVAGSDDLEALRREIAALRKALEVREANHPPAQHRLEETAAS